MDKADLSRFRALLPSFDVEETRAAKRAGCPAPTVHIGTVGRDAITLNVMAGAVVNLGDAKTEGNRQ